MTCIYTILSPTNKIYVGQTISFKKRIGTYKSLRCKPQAKLYNSLKKHGWSAHKCRPVIYLSDTASPETLTYWEQFVMDFYREGGYNLLNIRGAGSRGKVSQETREKLRKANIGKRHSDSHKRKMVESRAGYRHSKETKKKIKDSQVGRKRPQTSGINNPNFKGYILAYNEIGSLVGRFATAGSVTQQLGIPPTSVLRSIAQQRPLPRAGYTFVREQLVY